MECEGGQDNVSWVNLGNYHRVDVLARKGIRLIEPNNMSRYHWVAAEIVRTPSILNTIEFITQSNITVRDSPDWVIFPIGSDERV